MEECKRTLAQLNHQQKGPATQESEHEIVEALKQQIQICTEDFESERKDREKVQSKLHRALSECEHLKKEVRRITVILLTYMNFAVHDTPWPTLTPLLGIGTYSAG